MAPCCHNTLSSGFTEQDPDPGILVNPYPSFLMTPDPDPGYKYLYWLKRKRCGIKNTSLLVLRQHLLLLCFNFYVRSAGRFQCCSERDSKGQLLGGAALLREHIQVCAHGHWGAPCGQAAGRGKVCLASPYFIIVDRHPVSLPIRIRLSILMPIRIKIPPQVLHMLENQEFISTVIHSRASASLHCFIFLVRRHQYFCIIEIFRNKV